MEEGEKGLKDPKVLLKQLQRGECTVGGDAEGGGGWWGGGRGGRFVVCVGRGKKRAKGAPIQFFASFL